MSTLTDWMRETIALIRASRTTPSADEAVALAERAVQLADHHQSVEFGYRAREQLIHAANFGGRSELALVAFAWCRARWRETPWDYDGDDLLWKYKWILDSVPRNPAIRRAQIEAAHADFDEMFPAGQGERTRAKMNVVLALRLGDAERARAQLDTWLLAPRDHHSDCAACDLDSEVELLHALGEEADALSAAQPLLRGDLSCAEVPGLTYGYVAEAAYALGDDAATVNAVLSGYAATRANRDFLGTVGRLLGVLARTGNHVAGQRVVERHLDWLLACRMEADGHPFLAGARALFDAMGAGGEAEVTLWLPATFPLYRPDGRYPVELLADHFHQALVASCARFDARNGNATLTRWQEADRQRERRSVPMDLVVG